MAEFEPVYVLPEYGQWRVDYDGRQCDDAETLDEAVKLGEHWARKLGRSLILRAEDGTSCVVPIGPSFSIAAEPALVLPLAMPQPDCGAVRKSAAMQRERSSQQRLRARVMCMEMAIQRERIEEAAEKDAVRAAAV